MEILAHIIRLFISGNIKLEKVVTCIRSCIESKIRNFLMKVLQYVIVSLHNNDKILLCVKFDKT